MVDSYGSYNGRNETSKANSNAQYAYFGMTEGFSPNMIRAVNVITVMFLSPLADTSGASLCPSDLDRLYKFLKSAAPGWRKIGEALGFKFEELNAIYRKPGLNGEDENCFQELLHCWLKRTPDRTTKETLAGALELVDEYRLSVELVKIF